MTAHGLRQLSGTVSKRVCNTYFVCFNTPSYCLMFSVEAAPNTLPSYIFDEVCFLLFFKDERAQKGEKGDEVTILPCYCLLKKAVLWFNSWFSSTASYTTAWIILYIPYVMSTKVSLTFDCEITIDHLLFRWKVLLHPCAQSKAQSKLQNKAAWSYCLDPRIVDASTSGQQIIKASDAAFDQTSKGISI